MPLAATDHDDAAVATTSTHPDESAPARTSTRADTTATLQAITQSRTTPAANDDVEPAGRHAHATDPDRTPARELMTALRPPIRTRRRRRRRTPIWAIVSIVLGALVMTGGGGLAFGVQSLVNHVSNSIQQEDLLGNTVARTSSGDVSIEGVINVLLVGIDTRVANPAMGSRADSIIIMHIPASHDRAYLISIPRDTNVTIPAFPQTHYNGGQARINAAFQYGSARGGGTAGGFQLLSKTIETMYGVSFNGGAIVNFNGFKDIVKQLGGVDMYVDEKTTSLHDGFLAGTTTPAAPFSTTNGGATWHPVHGVTPVVYHVGFQHLSPTEALDFVRIRDFLPNGDYDRERHQQQFIKAVLTEAYQKGLQNPLRADAFLKSISKAFVFSGGGVSVANWIFTLKGIGPGSLMMIKVNNGTYNTLRVPRGGGGFDAREVLSSTSLTLMSDVAHDNVDAFVAAHPSWVSS
jgi:LCP family protein required for cell wall assembly